MSSAHTLDQLGPINGGDTVSCEESQAHHHYPHSEHQESQSPAFTHSTPTAGHLSPPSPATNDAGDALTLLPEVAATGRPAGSRRPFQRRRRSRACDACRARKTKCDTPDSGPCSACASASLVCKFSEGNEDRRRSGPARRIRSLENQIQDLQRKLETAESQLNNAIKHPLSPHPPSSPRLAGSSSITGSNDWWRSGQEEDFNNSRRLSSLGGSGGASGSGGFSHYIFESNPSFIASYGRYLRNLGYNSSTTEFPQNEPRDQRVPLLSEYTSMPNAGMDMRVFLPPKPFANKLLEVFRSTVQQFTPLFYWPKLEERFERAWSHPLLENDYKAVRKVFCIVEMLMAVATQIVETPELKDLGGSEQARAPAPHLQERTGWRFFNLARKYADLNNPSYSPDDAMFLLLMAMYLDNASLPSPSWMITGAVARVCQDIGLDRRPPSTITDPVELESRKRLFWAAYIQERKSSLKKGRPCIFRDIDIEVGLPSVVSLSAKKGDDKVALQKETGGSAGSLSPNRRSALGSRRESEETTMNALQCFKAQIHISQLCEELSSVRLLENGGPRDFQTLKKLDEKLRLAWREFPSEYIDTNNASALEMGAIRPLFYLQHCRLQLYRFFTESSPSSKLHPEFRRFCLTQSLQVAKISAHLISRTSRHATFDTCYGLRTDDLVQIQTFRSAIILLLGHCTAEGSTLPVSKDEIEICIRAMRSVAHYHFSGQKLLQAFENFARTVNYSSMPDVVATTAADVSVKRERSLHQSPPIYITSSQQQQQQQQQQQASVAWEYSHLMPGQQQNQQFVPPWGSAMMQDQSQGFMDLPGFGNTGPDAAVPIDWDAVQQALHFEGNLAALTTTDVSAAGVNGEPGQPSSTAGPGGNWGFI